ncbi:P-loop containing nucleoside triphosphate hydrolase protein [Mycena galericulata]|nr:P-loop containing nucleoside triphosphate hydrolase protein [Mycena galericulata]
MAESTFSVVQNIFKAPHPPISATTWLCAALTRKILQEFLQTAEDGILGVAPVYGTKRVLSVIAFASATKVLLVRLPTTKKGRRPSTKEADLLQDLILCAHSYSKAAFQMDVLATSLYHDLGLKIRGAVDLLSLAKDDRHSPAAIMNSIGGEASLNKPNVKVLFDGEEKLLNKAESLNTAALQAWVAWRAATLEKLAERLKDEPRIDTSTLSEARLSGFAKMVRHTCRLSAMKPTSVKNEIANDHYEKKGHLQVTSTRFKTRVRLGDDGQRIEIHGSENGQRIMVSGKVMGVKGRGAKINVKSRLPSGPITLTTRGKDPPTNAETQRAVIILNALKGTSTIADKPFFKAIWLPGEKPAWPAGPPSTPAIRSPLSLNDSQKTAVEAILSPQHINVIHGPPGTGKTTVIAAAVYSIGSPPFGGRTTWLVAQSNVAVKNIAEKLASVNFLDFKIVVSHEFHYDWHEHLYEKIKANLIRSDQMPQTLLETERQLKGSKVILCTLSMLSNPSLSNITLVVPLQAVIVDEASQVEVGNFLPLISQFSFSLRKLVFIGDDKQLAPYGQGDIDDLQSIFEMKHLRRGAIFLNTQYRLVDFQDFELMLNFASMPTQLGTFIGRNVYDNRLKTVHRNTSPCCHFIDVPNSKEAKKGLSWINIGEVRAVMIEAVQCHAKGHSYRIITPYDAQRGLLESALKASEVPWEDKVFCVDSFQGNEDEWIIVSIVRTGNIGFLAEQRRVNVMLSRCKRGMKICTNRAFVEGKAKKTLVGRLASGIGPSAWER